MKKKKEKRKRKLLSKKPQSLTQNRLTRFRKGLKKSLNTLVSFCDRRTPPPPLPLFHAHSRAPVESTKRIEWLTKSTKPRKKITHIHTTRITPTAT